MLMSHASGIAALTAVVLLLAGCAPVAEVAAPTPSATSTPTPTPTPTPEAPTPATVVLSVDEISVLDTTGEMLSSASYTDPDAVLALLSSVEGFTPEPVDNRKFGMSWKWPDVALTSNYWAFVDVTGSEIGGLPAQTAQGIHVGSTRAELDALDPHDWNRDADGDGVSDQYCLEVRAEPGQVSLVDPASGGITCVGVTLEGDVVIRIGSMSNDWFDI